MFSITKLFTVVTASTALAATSLLLSSSQVIMVNAFSVNNIKTTVPMRTQTRSQNLPQQQPISVLRYKTNEDEDGSSNEVVSTKTTKTAVKKIKQNLAQRTAALATTTTTATAAVLSAAPTPTTNGKTNSRVTGRSSPIKNIIEIETLEKFRDCMDTNKDVKLVVVRFYATWCKVSEGAISFSFFFALSYIHYTTHII